MSMLPTIKLSNLYHVGTLVASNKKAKSYEGKGLSVSNHPDAWREIAKLDGETWAFTNEKNEFLDYHSLTKTVRDEILNYGIAQGYIRPVTNWRVTWYNYEYATQEWTDYSIEADAIEEAADLDVAYHAVNSYSATKNFPDETVSVNDTDVDMILATIWVEETKPALSGVWWSDKLDPKRLCAPRGVINLSHLSEWSWEKI